MSELDPGETGDAGELAEGQHRVSWVTLAAAAVVILLALGAAFLPHGSGREPVHTLLVYDASGSEARLAALFEPLQAYLAAESNGLLQLEMVANLSDFRAKVANQPDFVFAPDGLAVELASDSYLPLVVGRRPAPRNLRPRGVLVYRRSAGDVTEPWLTHPASTVLGDSLSLTGSGALRRAGLVGVPTGCACGPDPYDHGPVLHALRLGGFDYAIVRQWDAERFFDENLLDRSDYAMRNLIGAVPDAVLMVSRRVPQRVRLQCGEGLSAIGRQQGEGAQGAGRLATGLAGLHLVGFNLLLGPDFDLVRKNYPLGWLRSAD